MTVQNQDKLNEALKLLEFVEDITTAWNQEFLEISDNTLYGLRFITSFARGMIEESCMSISTAHSTKMHLKDQGHLQ